MLIKTGHRIKYALLAGALAANNAFAALPAISQMIQQVVTGSAGTLLTLGMVMYAILEIIQLVQDIMKGDGGIVVKVVRVVAVLLLAYYWKDILIAIANFASSSTLSG